MASILPPIPWDRPAMSFEWVDWYTKLRNIIDNSALDHNSLTGLQGGTSGQYYHLTSTQYSALTAPTANRVMVSNGSSVITTDADLTFDGTTLVANTAQVSTGNLTVNTEFLVLPKTSGKGIKVDSTTPTYGWHDLLGDISIRGTGGTNPGYSIYRGGIRQFQFAVNDEVFLNFHIPHDYVPGTDLYIHAHWSTNGTTKAGAAAGTINGGSVTWGFEVSYAKGHQQAAFSAPITTTIAQNANSTLYYHHIAEVQLSAASPSGSQLNSSNIEVDGVIMVRPYLSANGITVSSGSVPAPFLHYVDIHYQSTGIPTKQKAPNFYT